MGVDADRLNQAVDKILSSWGRRSIYRTDDSALDDTVGVIPNIDKSESRNPC